MDINYSVLRDTESGYWFFIVFGKIDDNVYECDPVFDSESEAEDAALRWIADNLLSEK
jgi:hypothetical protein